MSANASDELSALLALEGAAPSSLPPIDDDSDSGTGADRRQATGAAEQVAAERGGNAGQLIQANRTTAATPLSPEFRKRICEMALPVLAEGGTLEDVAAEVGIVPSTLSGWLISIDEPAYREALAGQIGAQLARHGASMGECITQSEDAMRRTLSFETVSINGGKFPKDVLVGPVIAKVAQSRAEVLSTAARLLHWQAEKRLPKLFSSDETAGAGPVRASFSFVINGQPAPDGRVIQGEVRSTNEQP